MRTSTSQANRPRIRQAIGAMKLYLQSQLWCVSSACQFTITYNNYLDIVLYIYILFYYLDSIILFQSQDSIVCLAAIHFLRCCALAERAFGRTHNATVALRARLGDVVTLEGAKHGGWACLGWSIRIMFKGLTCVSTMPIHKETWIPNISQSASLADCWSCPSLRKPHAEWIYFVDSFWGGGFASALDVWKTSPQLSVSVPNPLNYIFDEGQRASFFGQIEMTSWLWNGTVPASSSDVYIDCRTWNPRHKTPLFVKDAWNIAHKQWADGIAENHPGTVFPVRPGPEEKIGTKRLLSRGHVLFTTGHYSPNSTVLVISCDFCWCQVVFS